MGVSHHHSLIHSRTHGQCASITSVFDSAPPMMTWQVFALRFYAVEEDFYLGTSFAGALLRADAFLAVALVGSTPRLRAWVARCTGLAHICVQLCNVPFSELSAVENTQWEMKRARAEGR